MRFFIVGVSCVGKTAIGSKLAELIGYEFFDLDDEIETFFSMPIEKLQEKFLNMNSFRKEASKALSHLLSQESSKGCVIALPPSGLMSYYWDVVKRSKGLTIALKDKPENILKRITFYDKDSKPIEQQLTKDGRAFYLNEIKKDITYFNKSYKKADIFVDVEGLNIDESTLEIKKAIEDQKKSASFKKFPKMKTDK
jgi:shikimate kinase